MVFAYPLHWPEGWRRTLKRKRSNFKCRFRDVRQEVLSEIARIGGSYPMISTNNPVLRSGLPSASALEPDDPGVAVYFLLKGRQMVFACDRWDRVRDNIRAIVKTIEALRGIERWGASDMMERAFTAFQALPPPDDPFANCRTADEVHQSYRMAAKEQHPDAGGSDLAFAELTRRYKDALERVHKAGA